MTWFGWTMVALYAISITTYLAQIIKYSGMSNEEILAQITKETKGAWGKKIVINKVYQLVSAGVLLTLILWVGTGTGL